MSNFGCVNITRKTYLILMIIPIILLCYFLFVKPEVVFEEQCPDKPYSLEIVKYGTGILDMKIAYIHYKMNGETVATKQLDFFNKLGSFDVVWDTSTDDATRWIDKSVHLTMTYAKNFQGDLETKIVDFDYNSVKH
ncbi:hypothetical protein FJQ98_11055 [Lysinibacillus agricola]|uniref:Uncharacterized protein n=2 Tax=Bacillaceae TaxID=186817 RepID=A0ABX7AZK1_9BACI|nr:hypothetical protein AN161_24190 [Lysinibacillus sp. FJAT-14222]QQP14495.1 hypothetical protein FJQ98_11055 [Lysinibacillus agricola]